MMLHNQHDNSLNQARLLEYNEALEAMLGPIITSKICWKAMQTNHIMQKALTTMSALYFHQMEQWGMA